MIYKSAYGCKRTETEKLKISQIRMKKTCNFRDNSYLSLIDAWTWESKISVKNHQAGEAYTITKSKHFRQAENRGYRAAIEPHKRKVPTRHPIQDYGLYGELAVDRNP